MCEYKEELLKLAASGKAALAKTVVSLFIVLTIVAAFVFHNQLALHFVL